MWRNNSGPVWSFCASGVISNTPMSQKNSKSSMLPTLQLYWTGHWGWKRVRTSRGNSSETQGPQCYTEKARTSGRGCKNKNEPQKNAENSASIHTACISSICLYGREAGNGESQSVSQAAHYIKKQCAWEQEHRESLKVRYFFSLQANLPVGRPYLGAWGLEHTCATHGL